MGNAIRGVCTRVAANREEPISWTIRKDYSVPRKVVVRSLEVLDSEDSPDRPGMMYETTLKEMVHRFDKVFGNGVGHAEAVRKEKVREVMEHLEKHTRRRRGDQFVQEGVIEWEQTKKVYELFRVDLNLFERIYFTVDVSESTAILSQVCSFFLVLMIITSIVVWMVSTLPSAQEVPSGCDLVEKNECAPEPDPVFDVIEQLCVWVFTTEYIIRLCTVHSVRFPLLNENFLEGVLTGKPGHAGREGHSAQAAGRVPLASSASTLGGPRAAGGSGHEFDVGHGQQDLPHQLPGKLQNTLRHVVAFANLVDLFAILPYWIELIQGSEDSSGGALMVLRILRLTRIFRVFKLGKYNEIFTLFTRVISQSIPALALMLFFISLGCCLFGTLIWFAEQGTWYPTGHAKLDALNITDRGAYLRPALGSLDEDNLEESPFYSIIHSFWYVIVTITTVGYGDLYPTTVLGKLIGALTILNGIIVLAMPIGVVGANFSAEYYRVQDEKKRRVKLKQQMRTRAQVEEEQDAALTKATGETDALESRESERGIELCRVDAARKDIVVCAEDIDEKWQQTLPQVMYWRVSLALKKFVRDLTRSGESAGAQAEAVPMVSLSLLESLDALTSRVHDAISTATSTEDLADYGLKEARQDRKEWADFADRCWLYVINMCHVEKAPDPPDFFEMKAHLELARAPQTAHSREVHQTHSREAHHAASSRSSPALHAQKLTSPRRVEEPRGGDAAAGSAPPPPAAPAAAVAEGGSPSSRPAAVVPAPAGAPSEPQAGDGDLAARRPGTDALPGSVPREP